MASRMLMQGIEVQAGEAASPEPDNESHLIMKLALENGTVMETERGQAEQLRRSSDQTTSLWLVDDHQGFRQLMAERIGQEPGLNCARQFSSAEALLAALQVEPAPDMVLTDYSMKGMTGAAAVPLIKAISPSTRVVVMTTFYDSGKKNAAMESGADGFLFKAHDWDANIKYLMKIAATRGTAAPAAVTGVNELRSNDLTTHRTSDSNASTMPTFLRAAGFLRALLARVG